MSHPSPGRLAVPGGGELKSLHDYLAAYEPTVPHNDALWRDFTAATDTIPYLRAHRDWVEQHEWGFGDRAFHYMWYLLLTQDVLRKRDPRLLEIGVYKGQVISLWSLIAAQTGTAPQVYAVSPLSGTVTGLARPLHHAMMVLSKRYRDDMRSGNHYRQEDYRQCVETIFAQFNLNFGAVQLLQGYSQTPRIKAQLSPLRFDLIYIDGGHRYEEVRDDLRFYGDLVRAGGYLVLDDAAFFQPGSVFWKGHESVSRAAEEIASQRFANVLNVGHNRIYQRLDAPGTGAGGTRAGADAQP